jgi:trans-2,3-dihydro-3-hydroxyanthranilate isomerase
MTSRVYRYQRIDVFTDRPFCGNPLAVFTRAAGLDGPTMQLIARELNLSETAFVVPAGDSSHDYTIRIFSPGAELAKAESPSLGTVFALAREASLKNDGRVVLDSKGGAVSVTMTAPMITMKHPCPKMGDFIAEVDAAAAMLSLNRLDLVAEAPPRVVQCGTAFTLVPLRDLHALCRIEFRTDIWRRTLGEGPSPTVVAFTQDAKSPYAARVRVFAPLLGVREDPATATACGAVGAYLVAHKLVTPRVARRMVMAQGVELGRASDVHVMLECENLAPKTLRIGGTCVWMGQGEIHLSPEA